MMTKSSLVHFVSAICLASFIAGCVQKKSSSPGTTSPPSISTVNGALAVPSMGGSTRMTSLNEDNRAQSPEACQANNHYNRLMAVLRAARFLMCSFGILEDNKVITVPDTNGANTYSFTTKDSQGTSHTYLLRSKVNANNYRIFSFYIDGVQRTEVYVVTSDSSTGDLTIWLSDYLNDANLGGTAANAFFSAGFTASYVSEGKYAFKNVSLGASAYNTAKSYSVWLSLGLGTPNYLWGYVSYGSGSSYDAVWTYSQFDSTEGATYSRRTPSSGTVVASYSSWNNSSGYACRTSGAYYSNVYSYTYTEPTPQTGAYKDSWDGTGTASTISGLDLTVAAKVLQCYTDYPVTIPTQTDCTTLSACSRD